MRCALARYRVFAAFCCNCAAALMLPIAFAQTPDKPEHGVVATPDIITALTLGDLPRLTGLLAAGADPNEFSPTFRGPVWLSSLIMGEKTMFWTMSRTSELSVEPGTNGRRGGREALAIASARGYPDVAELLIDRGVDVNSRLNVGATSILIAASNGNAEMVQTLIRRQPSGSAR